MTEKEISHLIKSQQEFFDSGKTRLYNFRKEQLLKLRAAIKSNEQLLMDALQADLHKHPFEAYTTEIGIVLAELSHTLSHLKKWMQPKSVESPLAIFPSSSKVYSEPLGLTLIISPWNYPFQLVFTPLIGAIAAGNCAIVKPSNQTKQTALAMEKIIKETFLPEYISVIQGPGSMVVPDLIDKHRFDHIFFTGSVAVGKQIMSAAAKHLTPVTLELGGKSPCIVDKDVNIDVAAKRIAWAKFWNAGQTCVGPDYLLVHDSVKEKLTERIIHHVKKFFGDNAGQSSDYSCIISEKRFDVLVKYLEQGKIIFGGEANREKKFIAPTMIENISLSDAIMEEEVFGPILPIITFKTLDEVITVISRHAFPLSLYVFTNNRETEKRLMHGIRFGGGCVNDALVHLGNPNLPFGGVGYSGMGRYHGKYSFDTFTHKKSIVKTPTFFDMPLRYAPFTKSKLKIAKMFMR